MHDTPSMATQRSGRNVPIRSMHMAADDMQEEGCPVRTKIPHEHVGDYL